MYGVLLMKALWFGATKECIAGASLDYRTLAINLLRL
jgi:hypothetical protein